MRELKVITAPDERARVTFSLNDASGLFAFEEEHWTWEEIPESGRMDYWESRHLSGLYSTLEAAEEDAAKTIHWLLNCASPKES